MTYMGCDISSANGILTTNDFSLMAKDYSFCLIECGIGNDSKSSTYEANKQGCVNSGIKILPYHFLYPLPNAAGHDNRDPVKQATLHYSMCNSPCAADIEWPFPADWSHWNIPNAAFIEDWTNAYMQRMKDLSGSFPILYTMPYFMQVLNNPVSFAKYDLWLALYADTPLIPSPWTSYVCWQYSAHGVLPNGAPLDLDKTEDLSIFS